MGKSFLRAILLLFFIAEFLFSAQFSFGLGRLTFERPAEFPFAGNNYSLAWTPMETSRLQLGLKYDAWSVVRSKAVLNSASAGFLTSKLVFQPAARASWFCGFNIGAGVLGESLAGWRGRFNNNGALEIAYLWRYQLGDAGVLLHNDIIMLNYSWLLDRNAFVRKQKMSPDKKELSKEGNLRARKEYLQKRLLINQNKLRKYDLLLKKYDLNEVPGEESLAKEKALIQEERAKLLRENSEIEELLAL